MQSKPSRRAMVRAFGAAAVASAAAPFFVRAEDKAAAKALVVGDGAFRYEVIDDWAKLPDGMKFGNTHAAAEAADGRILIHHQGGAPDSVFVFDADGKFVKSWGKEWRGGAHGMQLRKEGNDEFLYLATTGQRTVLKTTLDGEVLLKLEYPKDAKNAAGQPCYANANGYSPTNIAFHPTDGSFYVADGYGSSYVHHYSAKGEYVRTFGGKGGADGQLSCPHGIWCDSREKDKPVLVVADRSNERLQYFTLDGQFVKVVKPAQANGYRHPCHFDQRGDNLLVPGLQGVVSILGKDDQVVAYLGDNPDKAARAKNGWPKDKLVPGVFVAPHGAIWDRAGNIYVAEWLSYGRVTKLRHVG